MVNGYCILLFENDAMVVNKLSVLHDFLFIIYLKNAT